MIFRRENATNPSKRFKSVILNPVGVSLKPTFFYKTHQSTVGLYKGTKICRRRKKSYFSTKFNISYGVQQKQISCVTHISLARRAKTFVGLITHSTGSMSCIPIFNGSFVSQIIKVWPYAKTPKIHFFSNITTGSTVSLAYLQITNCFFNIKLSTHVSAFYSRAAGTFCIVLRRNEDRGYCNIKLPSSKEYLLDERTYVMLGRNSNIFVRGLWLGKAGINFKKGYRPSVRGVAMNPIDHPHGGRTKSNAPERTPWGKIAKWGK